MTDQRGKWQRLFWGGAPRNSAGKRREMTRGEQTAWIVGAIAVVAFLAFDYADSHDPSDPYSRCKSFFADQSCRSEIAMKRLNSLR